MIISKYFNANYNFMDLFEIDGKIRDFCVASAYVDDATIENLYKLFKENMSGHGARFAVFIDKASSQAIQGQEMHDKYMKMTKAVRSLITSNTKKNNADDSGIFLVNLGRLFHSKLVFIETTQTSKFLIGSMNMTVNGTEKDGNEELVLSKVANQREYTWITDYFENLSGKSIDVKKAKRERTYVSLREFFLSGKLFNVVGRNSNMFYFPMDFPKELYDKNIHIDNLIDSDPRSRLNVLGLCDVDIPSYDLDTDNAKNWKQFCLATDYGYWCPAAYIDKVSDILEGKIADKTDMVKTRLQALPTEEFNVRAADYFKNISNKLDSLGIIWKVNDEKWKMWLQKLVSRIFNEDDDGGYELKDEITQILITGVYEAPVPDIWYDARIFNEFEESFIASIQNEYVKIKKYNKLAKALTNNFNDYIYDLDDLKIALGKEIDFAQ